MNNIQGGQISESPDVTSEQRKKRGRKPGEKRKGYFYEEEENAFAEFVSNTDQNVRNRIFNEKLYPAFTKMIESIIRRYGLFTPDEDFEDTFNDTMSFMITKINNFDFTKGYKVYSYCGTVCKNYLLLKRLKSIKHIDASVPYESVFNENKNDRIDENNGYTGTIYNEIINEIKKNVQTILANENDLNENEIRIGTVLLYLLNNWDDIFDSLGSKKFNKTSVLSFLKENTNLSTKEIREAMKVYKDIYASAKKKIFD